MYMWLNEASQCFAPYWVGTPHDHMSQTMTIPNNTPCWHIMLHLTYSLTHPLTHEPTLFTHPPILPLWHDFSHTPIIAFTSGGYVLVMLRRRMNNSDHRYHHLHAGNRNGGSSGGSDNSNGGGTGNGEDSSTSRPRLSRWYPINTPYQTHTHSYHSISSPIPIIT